jgi:hypothetical protein
VPLDRLTPTLRSGYEKSLSLFQAIAPSAYTLRPHFEGELVRIPTSIPDDEMLYDRLRITDQADLGKLWCEVMSRVYQLSGIYTLNLHPERGVLCKPALKQLLAYSQRQPIPVWLACLHDVEKWWRERREFTFTIEPSGVGSWRVEAFCTPRATVLARHLTVDAVPALEWADADTVVLERRFSVSAAACPCIALSRRTSADVENFLHEQGYPAQRVDAEAAEGYALFLDIPKRLGSSRSAQMKARSALLARIESLERPLVHFGVWPDRARAALAITGDIDSITVQDFFLRIVETRRHA